MKKLKLYLSLTIHTIKTSLLSAFEYRTVFLMQVIGMIINDSFFLILWSIFFTSFPEIHGWTQKDIITLMALSTTSYGLVLSFCGGWNFSKAISMGELDQYITLPKSLLWQLLLRRIDVASLGDIVFGLGLYFVWGDLSLIGLVKFLGLTILATACIINFIVIIQSLAFYLGHIEEATAQWLYLVLGFSLYPQNQFHGALKIIMMTLVPAFYITTLPVNLLREFSWEPLFIIILFWLVSFILARVLFKQGLKHYESGNLIGVKI